MPAQEEARRDVVTIIEAWESLEHLVAHLKTPHMMSYCDAVTDFVRKVNVQIMEPA